MERKEATSRSPIIAALLTPDGKYAVWATSDRRLTVWDTAFEKSRYVIKCSKRVTVLALSHDNRYLIAGIGDGTLRILDLLDGTHRLMSAMHKEPITALALTPDDRLIFSGSAGGTITIWDFATGGECQSLACPYDRAITGLAVSPNGQYVICGMQDGVLEAWDWVAGERKFSYQDTEEYPKTLITVTPDSRYAVAAFGDIVEYWDILLGQKCPGYLSARFDVVDEMAIGSDGWTLVAATLNGGIYVYDLLTCRGLYTSFEDADFGHLMTLTASTNYCVSAAPDYTVRVWNVHAKKLITLVQARSAPKVCIVEAPEDKLLILVAEHRRVHLFGIDPANIPWRDPIGIGSRQDRSGGMEPSLGGQLRAHDVQLGREVTLKKALIGLTAPDPDARHKALSVLRDLGPPDERIVPALIPVLQDSNAEIARIAIGILARQPNAQSAIQPLIACLSYPSLLVRETAYKALQAIGPTPESELAMQGWDWQRQRWLDWRRGG